jgi:hypothetical protein
MPNISLRFFGVGLNNSVVFPARNSMKISNEAFAYRNIVPVIFRIRSFPCELREIVDVLFDDVVQ